MPDAALTRPTPEPLALLRYLDVVLVIAALPLVAFAGLPLLGYAVGAGAWITQRVAGALLERQAKRTTNVRRQVGLNLGSSLGRAWIVGGANRGGGDEAANLRLLHRWCHHRHHQRVGYKAAESLSRMRSNQHVRF